MAVYKITAGQTVNVPLEFSNAYFSSPTPTWEVYVQPPGGGTPSVVASASSPGGYGVAKVVSGSAAVALAVTVPASASARNGVQAIYEDVTGYYRTTAFDILPYSTPPGPPTALTATTGQDSKVPLSLTAPTGTVTGYLFDRSPVPGGPYTNVGGSSTTSWTDYTAVNGTTYYYTARAVNGTKFDGSPNASVASNQASATPRGAAGTLPPGATLWAVGSDPATGDFLPAPLLVDGSAGDGMTGYNGA